MYRYMTIRSDGCYSRFAISEDLIRFLNSLPGLRQSGPMSFESEPGSPWASIILAECDMSGSYTCDGKPKRRVNVVEVIVSASGDDSWYKSLVSRTAAFLGWEAIEEHEGRQLWLSDEST